VGQGILFKRIGITGSPGTGKKTLARGLALNAGYKILNINSLCISKGGSIGRDKYGIVVDTEKLSKIIAEEIKNDSFILVGHLLPYVIASKDIELAIVLRCNPYVLEKRLEKRRYPHKKVLMNIGAEILGTCYFDALKEFGCGKIHVIDTSSKKPEEVVRESLRILEGNVRYDGSDIDWLNLVRKKGDLRRLFPDSYY
jgi:adenylate kinase